MSYLFLQLGKRQHQELLILNQKFMNESESVIKRAHVFIEGRVQGVGFRHFTKTKARKMNLNGWVKNRSDGRVEAVFEGPKEQVMNMVEKCQKGPGAAKVQNVDLKWEETDKNLDSFKIKRF